jgi:tRNA (adenine22-N1)-methyltransferase
MMSSTLPPRLQAIADLVTAKQTVADIGTDHGILPIYLIRNRNLSKVIAADVNEDPLQKAEKLIQRYQLAHRIELRLGDGLKILEAGEADSIIIAGMGGRLIRDIIRASSDIAEKAEQMILQPIQSVPTLRKYLLTHGYLIKDEKLVQEKHRFYEIIHARYDALPVTTVPPITLEIGSYITRQDPAVAHAFVTRKIRLWEQKKQGLYGAGKTDEVLLNRANSMIEALREVLRWLE